MKDIKSALMSYSVYRKTQTPVPYFFKIEKGNKKLFYFGSNHSRDPEDVQYKELLGHWEAFLSSVDPKDCLVMNEGGLRKLRESKEESIDSDAEAGLITYLANTKGIEIISPEPERQQQDIDLLSKYSKEEVQYYYFARVVHQWGRIPQKPSFEEYIKGFLASDKEESGWSDFDFSLDHMKSIHTSIFKGDFDETNTNFFYSIINPSFRTTVINSFAQDQGVERDTFIASKIIEEWEKGKNIFIVFGESHAVIQEPALKKFA